MQIYYFSDFVNNLTGGQLEIFSMPGSLMWPNIEVDSNKKQVYIESKVYSFHKSLEIENVDGKNIIKREN
jgi:hypothetical protein